MKNHKIMYRDVIPRNLFTIPLMDIIKENINKWQVIVAIATVIIILLALTNWKKLKEKKFLLLFILIGIMPYVRYLILANHSYRHIMFTFRNQIITIIVLFYIIIECLNYELISKKFNSLKKQVKKKVK